MAGKIVSSKEEVDASSGFCIDPVDLNSRFGKDGKIYGYHGLKVTHTHIYLVLNPSLSVSVSVSLSLYIYIFIYIYYIAKFLSSVS